MLKLGSSGACLQPRELRTMKTRICIKGFLVAVTRNMAHKHTNTHNHCIVLYCILLQDLLAEAWVHVS